MTDIYIYFYFGPRGLPFIAHLDSLPNFTRPSDGPVRLPIVDKYKVSCRLTGMCSGLLPPPRCPLHMCGCERNYFYFCLLGQNLPFLNPSSLLWSSVKHAVAGFACAESLLWMTQLFGTRIVWVVGSSSHYQRLPTVHQCTSLLPLKFSWCAFMLESPALVYRKTHKCL